MLWSPSSAYDVTQPPDVFVAWRYHISLALAPSFSPSSHLSGNTDMGGMSGMRGRSRVFLWLQDVPSFLTYTEAFVSRLDAIFTLGFVHDG